MSGSIGGSRERRRLHRLSIVVLVIGAVAVGALTWITSWSHDRNEQRLLDQRVREAAAVLVTSLPRVQTPLAAGAELAEATNGDAAAFRRFGAPLVAQGAPFVSVSLWPAHAAEPRPVTIAGDPPLLATSSPEAIRSALNRATETTALAVIDLLEATPPRLGYAFASNQSAATFVAYAEAALPADRTAVVQQGSAFEGLDYALYLGTAELPSELLIASVRDLPISGRRSTEAVVFGDVSGRGLEASAAMAALRFATRGFALDGHDPAAILSRLRKLVDVERDGHFATILIALIAIRERTITIANAGHPSPVLRDAAGTRIIETIAGPPVGVESTTSYTTVTCDVGEDATLVAFTDGLFERRGEVVDVGMERVRAVLATEGLSLDELLSRLMRDVATRADDDTAIVGIRWQR